MLRSRFSSRKQTASIFAAILGGMAGLGSPFLTPVRGDLVVSYGTPLGPSNTPVPYTSGTVYNPATHQYELVDDYVVEAQNNGLHGTGSELLGFDATVTTAGGGPSGALFIDLNADINNDHHADADVIGLPDTGPYRPSVPTPAFGSTTGTFMGLGGATGTPGVLQTASKAVISIVFNNSQANPSPGTGVNGYYNSRSNYVTQTNSNGFLTQNIDSTYTQGTVHTLEVVETDVPSNAPDASSDPVQFMNIVIPHGTPFSIGGLIACETPGVVPVPFGTSLASAAGTPTGTAPVVSPPAPAPVQPNPNPASSAPIGPAAPTPPVTPPKTKKPHAPSVSQGPHANPVGVAAAELEADSPISLTGNPNSTANESLVTVVAHTPGMPSDYAAFEAEIASLQLEGGAADLNGLEPQSGNTASSPGGLEVRELVVSVPEPTGAGVLILGSMAFLACRRRTST